MVNQQKICLSKNSRWFPMTFTCPILENLSQFAFSRKSRKFKMTCNSMKLKVKILNPWIHKIYLPFIREDHKKICHFFGLQFSSVQSLSCVQLLVTPWIAVKYHQFPTVQPKYLVTFMLYRITNSVIEQNEIRKRAVTGNTLCNKTQFFPQLSWL